MRYAHKYYVWIRFSILLCAAGVGAMVLLTACTLVGVHAPDTLLRCALWLSITGGVLFVVTDALEHRSRRG